MDKLKKSRATYGTTIEVKRCTNNQAKETFEMYANVINEFKPTPVRYQGDWLDIENEYNSMNGSLFLIATTRKNRFFNKTEVVVGCMGVKRYGKIAILKHVAVAPKYQGQDFKIHFCNPPFEDYELCQCNIAKFMLETLEQFCKNQKLSTIIIGTDSYYPSGLKFYAKRDYRMLTENQITENTDIFNAYQDYKDVDDTWLIKTLPEIKPKTSQQSITEPERKEK